VKVIQDDLWLCDDCLLAAANGDFTGLDYHYQGKEADRRLKAIKEGLKNLGPHLVSDFDSESGEGIEEFSRSECDCCGQHLAGQRHRLAVLGEE
jgi:hypothetical protein